jgi:tetratricopeptide (TPR) repeat protein
MTMDPTFSAGVAALQAGRYADALALFAPLAERQPRSVDVLLGLASAQLGAGDARAALATATHARTIAPHSSAALYVMGPAAALANHEQRFVECLTNLRQLPASQAADLGAFWTARLLEHGHVLAAERVQRQLVAMAPGDYGAYVAHADTLLRLGETDAAGAALAEAFKHDQARGEAHALLAQQRMQVGDLDAAKQAAYAAIARNPRLVPAYAALADIDPAAIDDAMVDQLGALAAEDDGMVENRAAASLALAAALDAKGRYAEAFACIAAARQRLRAADLQRGKAYRRDATAARLSAELRLFPRQLLADPAPAPERGRGLVFIVGMPRSGSTLVDQALAGHSHVASRGESMALNSVRARFDAEVAAGADAAVQRHGQHWEALYRSGAPSAQTIADKNLFNFWNVGLIARLFPAARITIMRRDPVDVCFSIFRHAFIGEHAFANDIEDLAHYHRCFDRLADHWRDALPHAVLEVRYETLVQDFESGIRAILEHCRLPFEPACVRFHETKRVVSTSSAAQVRQPLFTSGVGRWRAYAAHLQPLIEALERNKPP